MGRIIFTRSISRKMPNVINTNTKVCNFQSYINNSEDCEKYKREQLMMAKL